MTEVLRGRVALVTGGGRGIGAAIAAALAGAGATTIICGRSQPRLQSTADDIQKQGGHCEARECDVTRLNSVQALAKYVTDRHGRLDILVNNAGVGGFDAPLYTLPPHKWDDIINTNLRGVYYCIAALVPVMLETLKAGAKSASGEAAPSPIGAGHIVNISSIASKNALPNGAAYAASKWGLNGLTYSVAEELRAFGLRVSLVCPGSTNTDLSPHTGKNVGKMLQPTDVARAVSLIVAQEAQSFASEIILRPTQKP